MVLFGLKLSNFSIILISIVSLIIIFLIATPFIITLKYFKIEDFGNFGSYLNGVASFLNLAVFIILTLHVANLGNSNSKMQLSMQKKIILSEFRQEEIGKLSDNLDSCFLTSCHNRNMQDGKNLVIASSIYLTNFYNQKKFLFPLLEKHEVKLLVDNLLNYLSKLLDLIEEVQECADEISMEQMTFIQEQVQLTVFEKNELIEKLQKFVLVELEQ